MERREGGRREEGRGGKAEKGRISDAPRRPCARQNETQF